ENSKIIRPQFLHIARKSHAKQSKHTQIQPKNEAPTEIKLLIPNNWTADFLICKQGAARSIPATSTIFCRFQRSPSGAPLSFWLYQFCRFGGGSALVGVFLSAKSARII